jgi:tetrahydromethanopterin S-methyltransferase subunit D
MNDGWPRTLTAAPLTSAAAGGFISTLLLTEVGFFFCDFATVSGAGAVVAGADGVGTAPAGLVSCAKAAAAVSAANVEKSQTFFFILKQVEI